MHIAVRRSALAFLLLLSTTGAASAKSYSADRFDVVVRLLADGSLQVTETLALRFESGTWMPFVSSCPSGRSR